MKSSVRGRVDSVTKRSTVRSRGLGLLIALTMVATLTALAAAPMPARAASGYTDDQGVDTCDYVHTYDMQDLWNNTPFNDFGYYLGGVNAADYALCAPWTASQLSTARTMGWGFTPLWDDLQAPKGCGPVYGNPPIRHDFGPLAQMSIDTTTAYNEGVTSANNALAAMAAAGFASYDTVWLDIEGYDRTQQSCINAVNAYVNGWSATAGVNGIDAGVYGSASGSGIADWAHNSHPPFAVWIADADVYLNTVWGNNMLNPDYWVYDQRMHQYRRSQHTYDTSLPHGYDVSCLNTWGDQGTNIDDETAEGAEGNGQTGDAYCYGTSQ